MVFNGLSTFQIKVALVMLLGWGGRRGRVVIVLFCFSIFRSLHEVSLQLLAGKSEILLEQQIVLLVPHAKAPINVAAELDSSEVKANPPLDIYEVG